MADWWYDIRKLKITERIALTLQAVLVLLVFIPAATKIDGGQLLNSVQIGILYLHHGGALHIIGGGLYCALLFAVPVAIWLVTLLLHKPRINYGICACLCALETMSSSCFYTTAQHRMSTLVTLNFLRYIIVTLEFFTMFVYIHAFFQSWQETN